MKKLMTHDGEIIKLIMDSLYSKGLTSNTITTETWNLAYSCIHARLAIETMAWKNSHIKIAA